jgi:glucan 1,3-beta-glucosidase
VGWLVDGGAYGPTSQQTLGVLHTIAQKYAQTSYQDVVVGIEVLNEPTSWSFNMSDLKQFFREAYSRVRGVSDTVVVIQDAFQPPSSYNGFMTPQDMNAQWVSLDHHYYQVFDNGAVGMQPWQHRQQVCNSVGSYAGADKWTFIGEWTGAMTDCAQYLNGKTLNTNLKALSDSKQVTAGAPGTTARLKGQLITVLAQANPTSRHGANK